MNQQQKRYAAKRIDELKEQKINTAKEKWTIQSIYLTPLERAILIRDGVVEMIDLPETSVHSLGYIENLYDFSQYENSLSFNRKKYNEDVTLITNEATRIQDLLILGDANEAIALIEAFSKF